MPEIRSATRRIGKATYAPIQPEPAEIRRMAARPRAWDKLALVRGLGIQPADLSALERRVKSEPPLEYLMPALQALQQFTGGVQPGRALRNAAQLAPIPAKNLAALGRLLADERRIAKTTVERQFDKIYQAYQKDAVRPRVEASGVTTAGTLARRAADLSGSEGAARADAGAAIASASERIRSHLPMAEMAEIVRPGDAGKVDDLESAYAWAEKNRVDLVAPVTRLANQLWPLAAAYSTLVANKRIRDLLVWIDLFPTLTEHAVDAFEERMTVEPLGRLHLERLEMTPVGIERGELVYTLPLAPKETVNITHKEWSTTTEEFEQIVSDSFEEYSEEGVAEKSDLSQSTESQARHDTAYSLSANYSYYGVSASVGYNSTSGDTKSQQDSRQQSVEKTRKASARTRKDHKVSFKVTSVAGTENQEVRVISNPSDTNALRIDYFQLMRKWRVDLFRYGLRMTYDLAIPNPGSDLIQKLGEIRALDQLIEQPFSFTLPLSAVDRGSWVNYAAIYGATVSAPPDDITWVSTHREYGFVGEDESEKGFTDGLDLEVDPDYVIDQGLVQASFACWTGHNALFDAYLDVPGAFATSGGRVDYTSGLEHLVGRSGKVSVVYRGRWLSVGMVIVQLRTRLTQTAFDRWRIGAWNAMRDGAQQSYQESRRALMDRRDKLTAELGQFDALTLRKMEREEVMKHVLRWLFGTDFDLMPPEIAALYTTPPDSTVTVLDPGVISATSWQRVLEYGEFIKFVHQAIEWENVLFFVYPYFWDSPSNAGLKRFLQHPDPRHREFLRGGSARVVLTVRPGFEESFTRLVEMGSFAELPGEHPYITIATEIQNYARTNYPGIPPANPDGSIDEDTVNGVEKGIRIGSWYEYTPTSGLDISLNTPYPDMA